MKIDTKSFTKFKVATAPKAISFLTVYLAYVKKEIAFGALANLLKCYACKLEFDNKILHCL